MTSTRFSTSTWRPAQRLPRGHLAIRARKDYVQLFREPHDVIATGIREQGRLIAYSICHRLKENPYRSNLLLAAVDPAATTMFHGDGTIVDPAYQGRQLGHRIFRLREQQIGEAPNRSHGRPGSHQEFDFDRHRPALGPRCSLALRVTRRR